MTEAFENPELTVTALSTMKRYQFSINGMSEQVHAYPDQSLLEVLREKFKITSVKNGCAPQGQCGCCLVLINGAPKDS